MKTKSTKAENHDATPEPMPGESFRHAYGVLQAHAETLRNQDEPNIDDLLTLVTESVAAFKVCQARIEAVEQALEKALGEAAGLVKENRAAPKAAQPTSTPMPTPTSTSTPTPTRTAPTEPAKPSHQSEPPSAFDDDGQDIPF